MAIFKSIHLVKLGSSSFVVSPIFPFDSFYLCVSVCSDALFVFSPDNLFWFPSCRYVLLLFNWSMFALMFWRWVFLFFCSNTCTDKTFLRVVLNWFVCFLLLNPLYILGKFQVVHEYHDRFVRFTTGLKIYTLVLA